MVRRDVPQNPPGTTGLVRDASLVPLSRDHHEALVQAQRLRRSAAATLEQRTWDVVKAFLDFYENELLGHFADEEELLLPRTESADPAGAERIRAEHRELHELAGALRAAAADRTEPRPLLRDLGELIDDHVRFEERAYFMAVQERIAPDALAELGRLLLERRSARSGPVCGLPAR
jgi:hemerythrin